MRKLLYILLLFVSVRVSAQQSGNPPAGTTRQPQNIAFTTPTDMYSYFGGLYWHLPTFTQFRVTADSLKAAISAYSTSLTPTYPFKTANYTAAANELVQTDNTSGNVQITLPNAPADKTMVLVKVQTSVSPYVTTIIPSGSDKINKTGGPTSVTLNTTGQGRLFQYNLANTTWIITGTDNAVLTNSKKDSANAHNQFIQTLSPVVSSGGAIQAFPVIYSVTGGVKDANFGFSLKSAAPNMVIATNPTGTANAPGNYRSLVAADVPFATTNTYYGSTLYALGDSYTAMNLYQSYLTAVGFTVTSNGIGGACIARGKETAPGSYVASMRERLPTAVAAGKNYLLIETYGNDQFYGVPLGDITSTSDSTYYGALKNIAVYCVQNSQKVIFLTSGQRGNDRGQYALQKAYVDAMVDVANRYGITVLNPFETDGITYENIPSLTTDNVHLNAAGQAIYGPWLANSIINRVAYTSSTLTNAQLSTTYAGITNGGLNLNSTIVNSSLSTFGTIKQTLVHDGTNGWSELYKTNGTNNFSSGNSYNVFGSGLTNDWVNYLYGNNAYKIYSNNVLTATFQNGVLTAPSFVGPLTGTASGNLPINNPTFTGTMTGTQYYADGPTNGGGFQWRLAGVITTYAGSSNYIFAGTGSSSSDFGHYIVGNNRYFMYTNNVLRWTLDGAGLFTNTGNFATGLSSGSTAAGIVTVNTVSGTPTLVYRTPSQLASDLGVGNANSDYLSGTQSGTVTYDSQSNTFSVNAAITLPAISNYFTTGTPSRAKKLTFYSAASANLKISFNSGETDINTGLAYVIIPIGGSVTLQPISSSSWQATFTRSRLTSVITGGAVSQNVYYSQEISNSTTTSGTFTLPVIDAGAQGQVFNIVVNNATNTTCTVNANGGTSDIINAGLVSSYSVPNYASATFTLIQTGTSTYKWKIQ